MEAGVKVEGLREAQRALARSGAVAPRELTKELRGVASDTADRAKQLAPVKSGKLQRSIKPYARRGEVGIRASAHNEGYPYPRRLEYDPRIARSYMRRAMAETVDENKISEEIAAAIERAVNG